MVTLGDGLEDRMVFSLIDRFESFYGRRDLCSQQKIDLELTVLALFKNTLDSRQKMPVDFSKRVILAMRALEDQGDGPNYYEAQRRARLISEREQQLMKLRLSDYKNFTLLLDYLNVVNMLLRRNSERLMKE